jgi:type IV secretory pathway VirB2 component (pilin)
LLSAFFLALATTRMDHIDVSNPRFAMSAVMPSCLTDTARNASRLSRIARGPRAQVLAVLRVAPCALSSGVPRYKRAGSTVVYIETSVKKCEQATLPLAVRYR